MSNSYHTIVSVAGSDARTNVSYALNRLQAKFPDSVTWQDIIEYTFPEQQRSEEHLNLFKQFLRVHSKISHDPNANSYRFRPPYDIASAEDLLDYLQKQETASGVSVPQLKEGWPDVEDAVDKLEMQHKLLVWRNKKDNQPRLVWANDPTLFAPLDQEFKEIWLQTPLPAVEDTIKELKKMNHKTAGEIQAKGPAKPIEKKKRARRGNKITNQHMQGLFKDYSHVRPNAAK